MRRRLDEILAKHTGQDLEKVAQDTERDYFMSAEEAKEYDLIDASEALAALFFGNRPSSQLSGTSNGLLHYWRSAYRLRTRLTMARPTDSNEQLLCSFCGSRSGRSRS